MPSLNLMAEKAKNKKLTASKKVPAKATKKAPPPTSSLSSEFIQDSDIEQDEKPDEPLSSDEDDSLSEKSITDTPKTNDKTAAVAIDSGSSANESEGSEATSSEDEQPSKVAKTASSESAKSKTPKPSTTKTVSFNEAVPYKPPPGFELTSLKDNASTASQLLQKSNLEGKQVWYITAPASVPIASIRETSLANISNGKPVLSHNGNDYGFIQDFVEDITSMKVMVPRTSDDSYSAGSKSIDRILHLQQIIQLPSVYDANSEQPVSSGTARSTIPAKKPIRQQPAGLRMRFRPIGFGNGSTGAIGKSSSSGDESVTESTSDEEMEDGPSQFHRPASLEADESATSSNDSDDDSSSGSDVEMTDAPPLVSKPAAKSKSGKSAVEESIKGIEPSLKRKHSDGEDLKPKNSSSSSKEFTNNRELKENKKTRANFPEGSQSVSTESPKKNTKSSQLAPKSASQTLPVRQHHQPTSSQTSSSHMKSTPILPPKMSQILPAQISQASITYPASQKDAELLPERAVKEESETKEREKEAEILKKDKSKHLSKANWINGDSINESVPIPRDTADAGHRHDLSQSSASLSRSLLEKRVSKEERKEKKKRKIVETHSSQQKDSVADGYSHSPIPPPARSYSAIPPPKSTLSR